ncbi:hypothetical protein MUK42_30168 [Musa troglodytarum]|uniref:Uncharacterized protein n=1 Tax=Musa troglodytarum TaxID=320322 RepID=A0A9E7FA76_9LILI|nr:hypothetical protein MUK42_30168 [Musa troglodytarum]
MYWIIYLSDSVAIIMVQRPKPNLCHMYPSVPIASSNMYLDTFVSLLSLVMRRRWVASSPTKAFGIDPDTQQTETS